MRAFRDFQGLGFKVYGLWLSHEGTCRNLAPEHKQGRKTTTIACRITSQIFEVRTAGVRPHLIYQFIQANSWKSQLMIMD